MRTNTPTVLPTSRGPPTQSPLPAETEGEVLLEAELPFWTEQGDVAVRFGQAQLEVAVRNGLHLRRTFWRNK